MIYFVSASKSANSKSVSYRGESFAGYNKPKRAPEGDEKKYVVLAKSDDTIRKLKFGQRGYEDYLQHGDEKRRQNFKNRMNCAQATNKLTPKYWACNYNW